MRPRISVCALRVRMGPHAHFALAPHAITNKTQMLPAFASKLNSGSSRQRISCTIPDARNRFPCKIGSETRTHANLPDVKTGLAAYQGTCSTMIGMDLVFNCSFQVTTPYLQRMQTLVRKKLLLSGIVILFSMAALSAFKNNGLAIL